MAPWPCHHSNSRTAWIPLLALLLVGAAACGGAGSTTTATTEAATVADTAPAATTTPTSQAGGPPQTPVTGPVATAPPPRPKDPYLPAGVVDQIFPPGTKAFQLLAAGQCGPLLRQIQQGEAPTTTTWKSGGVPDQLTLLYTAAAQACLSHWSIAETDLKQVVVPIDCGFDTTTSPPLSPPWSSSFDSPEKCQATRTLVYSWAQRLVVTHRANPNFVPNFPTPPKP